MTLIEFKREGPKFKFSLDELNKTSKNPFFNNDKGEWAAYSIEQIVDVLQNSNIRLVEVVGGISEIEIESFKPGYKGNEHLIGQKLFIFNEFLK